MKCVDSLTSPSFASPLPASPRHKSRPWSWRAAGFAMASIAATLGLGACRGPSLVRGVGIEVDKELTKTQKEKLSLLSARVSSAEVHVPTPREGVTMYQLYFGSSDLGGVVRYLDERIAVLLAPGDLDSVITSRVSPQSAPVRDEGADDDGMTTIATNVGTFLWMTGLTAPDKATPAVQFNGRKIIANSMRSGIIQLDYGFFDESFSPAGSELAQLGTLVHEARHSDCTGGMRVATLVSLIRGEEPASHACGHLHGICPEGHPLAGILACDVEPWGAYAAEAAYAMTVKSFCSNCSQSEKMALLMSSAESTQRVVPFVDMADGRAGVPNLSSSDAVLYP